MTARGQTKQKMITHLAGLISSCFKIAHGSAPDPDSHDADGDCDEHDNTPEDDQSEHSQSDNE